MALDRCYYVEMAYPPAKENHRHNPCLRQKLPNHKHVSWSQRMNERKMLSLWNSSSVTGPVTQPDRTTGSERCTAVTSSLVTRPVIEIELRDKYQLALYDQEYMRALLANV